MVDPDLLRAVHREVGDRLHREQQRRLHSGQGELLGATEQQYARKLIADVIREHAEKLMAIGQSPLDPETEQELAEGVHARMFGAGRLQGLLNDDSIEEISINGYDEVWVSRADADTDRPHELVDPVATSDEELIELVQGLAAYAGLNSRPWDAANPELDLTLADGSRLSAVMGVTPRPTVSIRRHRWDKAVLADLVGNGTMTDEAAEFLRAIIRARFNVMIAGGTKAGKTTLLRAMAAEVGPEERIITIENTLELGLHKFTDRHPNCVAMEARAANSEGQGEIKMDRLVRRTLRMAPDRVIVGEVLGPEVVQMLLAMGQGNDGSLSTIHARSAREVFERIATYGIMSAERLPHEASFRLAAGGLDYVVFISRHPKTGKRRLESILEVNGYDDSMLSSEIFAAGPLGPAAWTGTVPARRDYLSADGWQLPSGQGTW
ncbi:MAG: CpaF family protein [Nocardioides sp.]